MVVGGGDERWAQFRTNWCNRDLQALLVGMRNATATLEDSLAVTHKTINILLLSDPITKLLGIYSKELEIYAHTKACTSIFITILFTIAQNWKQPKCPSLGEQINKLCYIHICNVI